MPVITNDDFTLTPTLGGVNSFDKQHLVVAVKADLDVKTFSYSADYTFWDETTAVLKPLTALTLSKKRPTKLLAITAPASGTTYTGITNRDSINISYTVDATTFDFGTVDLVITSVDLDNAKQTIPLGTFSKGTTTSKDVNVRIPIGLNRLRLESSNGPYSAECYITGGGAAAQIRVIFSWKGSSDQDNSLRLHTTDGDLLFYAYTSRKNANHGFFDQDNTGKPDANDMCYETFYVSEDLGYVVNDITGLDLGLSTYKGDNVTVTANVFINEVYYGQFTGKDTKVTQAENYTSKWFATGIGYTYQSLSDITPSEPVDPIDEGQVFIDEDVKDQVTITVNYSGTLDDGTEFSGKVTQIIPDYTPPNLERVVTDRIIIIRPFDESIGKHPDSWRNVDGTILNAPEVLKHP